MFSLFKKKHPAAEGGEHRCICQPSDLVPVKSPFEEVTRLTGPYEDENVSLARCSRCGESALYYSADVYDDFWQYWCTIDEDEKAQLLEPDEDADDPQRAVRARSILQKHRYLRRGPVHGFEWGGPGSTVVQGPPW